MVSLLHTHGFYFQWQYQLPVIERLLTCSIRVKDTNCQCGLMTRLESKLQMESTFNEVTNQLHNNLTNQYAIEDKICAL